MKQEIAQGTQQTLNRILKSDSDYSPEVPISGILHNKSIQMASTRDMHMDSMF